MAYEFRTRLLTSSSETVWSRTVKAYNGIYLENVINGRIENNTCENNRIGIFLDSSSYDNLTSNTCENSSYHGIYLYSSSNNNLTGNTC